MILQSTKKKKMGKIIIRSFFFIVDILHNVFDNNLQCIRYQEQLHYLQHLFTMSRLIFIYIYTIFHW